MNEQTKQKAAMYDAAMKQNEMRQAYGQGRADRDYEVAAQQQMKQDYANAIMTESPEKMPQLMEYAQDLFTTRELDELVAGRQALDMEATRGGLAGAMQPRMTPQEEAMMQLQQETGQSNFQEQMPAGLANTVR